METKWTAGLEDAKKRLDVFLTEHLTSVTRSAIAKHLKDGAGRINGKTASVHAFLKDGDVVTYEPENKTADGRRRTVGVKRGKTGSGRNLSQTESKEAPDFKQLIIKETPSWIVINKPAGLLSHVDSDQNGIAVAELFAEYDPRGARVGEDPSRPGIVHRLDKEASGLMVIARTQDAFDNLKKQFAGHQVQKTYLALVYDAPPAQEGDIRFRIGRSSGGLRMAAKPVNDKTGKAAWSHYQVIKQNKNLSLLEVQIFSGRTHQIRAHLHALGCPIVGDPLYRSPKSLKSLKSVKSLETERLMLQSIGLAFNDPSTGERVFFTLPPDESFKQMK